MFGNWQNLGFFGLSLGIHWLVVQWAASGEWDEEFEGEDGPTGTPLGVLGLQTVGGSWGTAQLIPVAGREPQGGIIFKNIQFRISRNNRMKMN